MAVQAGKRAILPLVEVFAPRFFAPRTFSTTAATSAKLSDVPEERLVQYHHRKPDLITSLLPAAQAVATDTFMIGDTETTGIGADEYGVHKLISFALIKVEDGDVIYQKEWKFNPKRPMSWRAAAVTNVGDEELLAYPTFEEQHDEILAILLSNNTYPLWFHNAVFDLRVLNQQIQTTETILRPSIEDEGNVYCSLQLARLLRGKHNSLDALLDEYDIDAALRQEGHGALVDILLLKEVLHRLAERVLEVYERSSLDILCSPVCTL